MNAQLSSAKDRGGAFNALAHYWITRFNYDDRNEQEAVPEFNLEEGGVAESLGQYLSSRHVSRDDVGILTLGFEIGIHFASALASGPLGQPEGLRDILDLFRQYGYPKHDNRKPING